MDKSPILPAEHDPECRRTGPGDLDKEGCERCRNLSERLDQFRGIYIGPDSMTTPAEVSESDSDPAPPDKGTA